MLVVEDEVLIRLVIADHLRESGYQVIEAGDAAEALGVLRSPAGVDAVFSDVQMPGDLDGFALAQWIKRHRPGVKVLLTSGNARSVAAAHQLSAEGPFEAKPYHPRVILSRLHDLLGEGAPEAG
ncbi:response regulator [Acidisoma sp. C75]